MIIVEIFLIFPFVCVCVCVCKNYSMKRYLYEESAVITGEACRAWKTSNHQHLLLLLLCLYFCCCVSVCLFKKKLLYGQFLLHDTDELSGQLLQFFSRAVIPSCNVAVVSHTKTRVLVLPWIFLFCFCLVSN